MLRIYSATATGLSTSFNLLSSSWDIEVFIAHHLKKLSSLLKKESDGNVEERYIQIGALKEEPSPGLKGKMCFASVRHHRQWSTFLIFWWVAWASLYLSPKLFWDFEISESLLKTGSSPGIISLILLWYTFHVNSYGSRAALFTNIPWIFRFLYSCHWPPRKLFFHHIPSSGFRNPTLQQSQLKAHFSQKVSPSPSGGIDLHPFCDHLSTPLPLATTPRLLRGPCAV